MDWLGRVGWDGKGGRKDGEHGPYVPFGWRLCCGTLAVVATNAVYLHERVAVMYLAVLAFHFLFCVERRSVGFI